MLEKKHDKYGFKIRMFVSDPKDYAKNAIVERFNRTHRRSMVVYKCPSIFWNSLKMVTARAKLTHPVNAVVHCDSGHTKSGVRMYIL
jgi:hypothetical protein